MRSKSVVWIPVLLIGSLFYWTLAFGFGGMSLMAFTMLKDCPDSIDDGPATSPNDSYQSITVNLSDFSADGDRAPREATNSESEPSALPIELVPDRDPARASGDEGGQGSHGGNEPSNRGPGDTAF